MSILYAPSGKAAEYSPLAVNVYSWCDHGCEYCYVPSIFRKARHEDPHGRMDLTRKLDREISKWSGERKQVLLCFTTDAYQKLDEQARETRNVLKSLHRGRFPVAILTKGGTRCMYDLDAFRWFGNNIKVGATLTMDNDTDSLRVESKAALPDERLEMLRQLHAAGIKTWASIEPVIDPAQSLRMMERSLPFCDAYKVGKLNHRSNTTDWAAFLKAAVDLLTKHGKPFYVKDDLAVFASAPLPAGCRDRNRLFLTPVNPETEIMLPSFAGPMP